MNAYYRQEAYMNQILIITIYTLTFAQVIRGQLAAAELLQHLIVLLDVLKYQLLQYNN